MSEIKFLELVQILSMQMMHGKLILVPGLVILMLMQQMSGIKHMVVVVKFEQKKKNELISQPRQSLQI